MIANNLVAISSSKLPVEYPKDPPFYPAKEYPELKGRVRVGRQSNIIYDLFRELMCNLEMDAGRFSQPDWNPFGEIITPGQKILIKPNLVRHVHLTGGDYEAVVTHGSLVRCVLDYVALALNGQGEVFVGDAPLQSADFGELVKRNGLMQVCEDVQRCWGISVTLVDFRLSSVCLDETHTIIEDISLNGDPKGYLRVNLGKRSLLAPLAHNSERFRVTSYDCGDMQMHHNETVNEYMIPRTVLDADVVINLPKLKTHRKAGLTAAIKNLVGINGYKDWLPHHRTGSVREGGDEYLNSSKIKKYQTYLIERISQDSYSRLNVLRRIWIRVLEKISRMLSADLYSEGSWYGNDTLWRTVLDLNRLLLYANKQGEMKEEPQRKSFTFVDAIVAGEGEGPMEPDARRCGLLVGGTNPIAVDTALAILIGFDFNKIPLIANGFNIEDWPLVDFRPEEIKIRTQNPFLQELKIGESFTGYCFLPTSGWLGHIETRGWKWPGKE